MSQRYEREIDELLRRMDGRLKHEPMSRRLRRRTAGLGAALERAWRAFLRRSPVEQFMIAGVILTLVAFALQSLAPRAAFFSAVIAVVLFVLAIGISVATHRATGLGEERRWRGRPVDPPPSTPAWWLQARRWWWRWRRRFR